MNARMDKDYKKMWGELRAFLNERKKRHDELIPEYAMLGSMLSEMMIRAFDVVLAQMERLETGEVRCFVCGALLKAGEDYVCKECCLKVDEVKNNALLNELLFNSDNNS